MNDTKKIVHELIGVSRMHHRSIENAVRSLQIHQSGHHVLMFLAHSEATPSQKEIAHRFDISPAAVTGSLKKLEKDGYILRCADEGDTRLNRISITEKGKAVSAKTETLFNAVDEQTLAGFNPEERELLYGYLLRIKKNLSACDTEDSKEEDEK